MKFVNILKMSAVVFGVATLAVSAMDGEFAPLNPAQAKMRGSFYKSEYNKLAGHAAPKHETIEPAIANTHTVHLVQAYTDGNFDLYLNPLKARAIAHVDAYIDSLRAADGAFIVNAVNHRGLAPRHEPADLSRDGFKAWLADAINTVDQPTLAGVDPLADVPADLELDTLTAVHAQTKIALATHLKAQVDRILPGPNAAFLDLTGGHVHTGGVDLHGVPTQPADDQRDSFKAEIDRVLIQSY